MSFNITLYENKSANNVINKDLVEKVTYSGTLRDECSITNPVIRFNVNVEGDIDDLKRVNYMYIPKFGRYYFINDLVSVRTDIMEIHARVDVLKTYWSSFKNDYALTKSCQDRYNLYLNDGRLKASSVPTVVTKNFPQGFGGSYNFVLVVAGDN